MPRQARIVIPDTPHHITQRGNYRQDVFVNQTHYKQYCDWIDAYAKEAGLDILAYCIMRNHVHFIVIPKKEEDLGKVFKTVHMRYAHYLNRERNLRGHLWQGRFYSSILDNTHLYRAIRYVENNPVRAKIVKRAWAYEWSSAKDHIGERGKVLIKLKTIKDQKDWKEYLTEDDIEMAQDIRLKTDRGLVVGTDEFIKQLEGKLKRSLKCLKQGRPRKGA